MLKNIHHSIIFYPALKKRLPCTSIVWSDFIGCKIQGVFSRKNGHTMSWKRTYINLYLKYDGNYIKLYRKKRREVILAHG